MSAFARVQLTSHRGSLGGKVIDAYTKEPIASASAIIEMGPAEFQGWLAVQSRRNADRLETGPDGVFGFVDLPDGSYSIAIHGPPGMHYGSVKQSFTVDRNIPLVLSVISLPPTGATGSVQAEDTLAPLPLARVFTTDSRDVVYADRNGKFVLRGIFPGDCKITVGAVGYKKKNVTASFVTGNMIELGSILLEPNGA